jgi:pimeloyl-ACP methyl ester carboxylesterase
VVCGRNDQLTPPKLHRELADEIPGARLVTFSYGGHIVAAESAERLNHLVLQFLAE